MNAYNKNLKRQISQIVDFCIEKGLNFDIMPELNLISITNSSAGTICRFYYAGILSGTKNNLTPKEALVYLRKRY